MMAMSDGTPIAMVFTCSVQLFQAALEAFGNEKQAEGKEIGQIMAFFLCVEGGGGTNNLIRTPVKPEIHNLIDYIILTAHDGCGEASPQTLADNVQMLRDVFPYAEVYDYWVEVQILDQAQIPPNMRPQNWRLN